MDEATRDRLEFTETRLENGIGLYAHEMDVPFFEVHALVPVGSAHAGGANERIGRGMPHFLEHALFNRSQTYRERNEFERMISLKGGYWNAATGKYWTDYYVSAPTVMQEEVVDGLVDHLLRPEFAEEDLAIERTVVANERNQRRWYPSSTELGQYLFSEWMTDRDFPKEQVFGSDEDLAAMSPETLSDFHATYATPGMNVVIGGSFDAARLERAFGAVATRPRVLTPQVEPIGWGRREYHERGFRDIDHPALFLGGFRPEFRHEEAYALDFALNLLTNSVHGPLYDWTRRDKGWSYGIDYTHWSGRDRTCWFIKLPVNERGEAEEARAGMDERIRAALRDEGLIRREADRRRAGDVYAYQTIASRLSGFIGDLKRHGRGYTQAHYVELLGRTANADVMGRVYDRYLAPAVRGEFLAVPEA